MIAEFLSLERKRWILWTPVFFGIGIFVYFSLLFEPSIIQVCSLLFISAISLYISWRFSYAIFMAFLCLFLTVCGFSVASFRARIADAPVLENISTPISVRAKIVRIEERSHGKRLILENPDLWQKETGKFPKSKTPHRIRLEVRTKMEESLNSGDIISVYAILSPPHKFPVYPNAYDFARKAYFSKIGATGFSINDVRIFKKADEFSISNRIEMLRRTITSKILQSFDEKSKAANIATALITGERGAIDKKILENMRTAGLGHLLAISGLHLALIMAGCFFVSRAILAMIPLIALNYDIKKWAAIAALSAGLFYLLITGMPVSAKRAYIMAGIFFIAILLGRTGTPLRPVVLAAFIVMIIEPESVMGPSFQMSFSAVIALIAFFESFSLFRRTSMLRRNIATRMCIYIFGVIISSIIAGTATAPFALYHFGRYANYGLLANLIAIPLASFWIMPFGMLALFLMPFGLEKIAFTPMGYGIDIMTDYASFISNLSYSSIPVSAVSSYVIIAISIGGLWLCLWRSKGRYLGLIPIIIGVLFIIFPMRGADIIVDGGGKLYAVRTEDGGLAFSSFTKARYARSQWLKINGQMKPLRTRDVSEINCIEKTCTYSSGDYRTVFIEEYSHLKSLCDTSDIIVNLSDTYGICDNKDVRVINKSDLLSEGTHLIKFGLTPKITTVKQKIGNRLWTVVTKKYK